MLQDTVRIREIASSLRSVSENKGFKKQPEGAYHKSK